MFIKSSKTKMSQPCGTIVAAGWLISCTAA